MKTLANKNYPYPVITYDTNLSSYNNIEYKLTYSREDNDNEIIFNNVKIETNSIDLINLLNQGKLKALFSLNCPRTYYKYNEEIGLTPKQIIIKLSNLKNDVSISAYVYANSEIKDYVSDSLLEEYSGYKFNIEKYSLFAIDDGFTLPVEYDDFNDMKVSSIFSISEIEDDKENLMKVYPDERKIRIALPKEKCRLYNGLKDKEEFAPIFFSVIAEPALTICLKDLQTEGKPINEITEQYSWFKSIIKSYKKINLVDLDDDLFQQLNCFEFSQQVLNFCIANSFEALTNIFQNSTASLEDVIDEED